MSKKAQADAAYERQEDQRALVVVIAAALGEERSEERARVAECVERVKRAFLKVEAPAAKPEPSVPGQINLLAGTVESCPNCGVPEFSWSILPLDGTTTDEQARVQCGMCSYIFPISFTQYNAIVAERRRTLGESDRRGRAKPGREARVREAG